MPPKKYKTVSIPRKLLDEVENLVKEHPELGYASYTEFVREAVRIHIRRLKEELEKEK